MPYNFLRVANTQYPVGQGGLHLGEIYLDGCCENGLYAYIYDCGTINKKGILNKQIDNLLEDLSSQKHVLIKLYIFISHLHVDHVGGLVYLKQKLEENNILTSGDKINIYLPYMKNIEKKIAICSYFKNDTISFEDYKQLIINPDSLFSDYFKIIYISDKKGNCRENKNRDNISVINHTENLKFFESNWTLKSFYKPMELADKSLIEFLKKIKIKNITENFVKELQNKYRETLEQKELNLSSLCLYSGFNTWQKPECAYFHTGDVNLKDKNLQNKMRKYYGECLNNVKIAQIPHHGSKNNSSLGDFKKIFPNYKTLFVTKQKQPKGYRQPKYSQEYINMGDKIEQITEDPDSKYTPPTCLALINKLVFFV